MLKFIFKFRSNQDLKVENYFGVLWVIGDCAVGKIIYMAVLVRWLNAGILSLVELVILVNKDGEFLIKQVQDLIEKGL